jgi:hypothetical protein
VDSQGFVGPARVEVENPDDSWVVNIDQRDAAKWEVSALYGEGRMFTMIRHCAWTASVRAGKTTDKWATFNERLVFAGDPPDDDEEGAARGVDPTRPDQSAGS